MKTLMNKYRENEDHNAHTENYLLLAKNFGTPDQVNEVQKILKGNNKRGYAKINDLQWMHKEINPYFAQLITENDLHRLFPNTSDKKIRQMATNNFNTMDQVEAERALWNQKFN